jgi:hypothetical protein
MQYDGRLIARLAYRKDKHAVKVMVAVAGECEESHLSLPNNET